MTFDARGGGPSSGNGAGNLVFGIAAIGIVGAAFTAAFLIFGSGEPTADTVAAAPAPKVIAAAQVPKPFKNKAANKYLQSLAAVDQTAHAKLQKKMSRMSGRSEAKQFEAVLEHGFDVLKDNASDLAKADAKHLDRLLNHARSNLKKAARSNSQWCRGSKYAELEKLGPAGAKKLQRELTAIEGPMQDYALEAMTLLMDAIADARANPVKHGKLTPRDEMAVQGVFMSMMSDPQILPLMMGAQSGQSPEQMMAKLNVCDLGATFVSAVKTLPQDTKGRVWAEVVRETELGGGDFGQFGGLGGF